MGGVLRQGLRALAIYFTDVLLWLSVAGILEVLLVVGAGLLCILTAGFVFESMKRSPVVLVLGSIVALSGTFLMFREVRGMIWPAEVFSEQQGGGGKLPQTPSSAPPTASLPPVAPPSTGMPKIGQPILRPPGGTGGLSGAYCSSITSAASCKAMAGCVWSTVFNSCASRFAKPTQPPRGGAAGCGGYSKLVCSAMSSCYWSAVTERCETLRFRGLLGLDAPGAKPVFTTSCWDIKSAATCTVTNGCTWSSGRCLFSVPRPQPPAP